MSIDKELMEILVCPECKGKLELIVPKEDGLECKACKLLYSIKDGIPVMLASEATKLEG